MSAMRYDGRTVFTQGRAVRGVVFVALVLFATGFGFMYATQGWTVTTGVFLFLVVFGLAGLIESFVERITLASDAMVIRRLWGTRRVPIAQIAKFAEAKGVAPILLLTTGEKIELPSVGASLGNSVRAWLRVVSSSESSTPS
jgi:hypothetical protein